MSFGLFVESLLEAVSSPYWGDAGKACLISVTVVVACDVICDVSCDVVDVDELSCEICPSESSGMKDMTF